MGEFFATVFVIIVFVMLAWMLFSILWPLIVAVFWVFAAGFASGGIFVVLGIIVILIIVNQ